MRGKENSEQFGYLRHFINLTWKLGNHRGKQWGGTKEKHLMGLNPRPAGTCEAPGDAHLPLIHLGTFNILTCKQHKN